MKKMSTIAAAVLLIGAGTPAMASFGDALVGGVVGGVVGSVITNEVYRNGHRSHRYRPHHRVHRKHKKRVKKRHVAPVHAPVMTDEKRIQKALTSLGFYHGPIDGVINSFETRSAIKEMNKAYEIGNTSYMSPQERDALIYLGTLLQFDRYLISQGTDSKSKGKRIQTALKIHGFYHGKIDGVVGRGTRSAITAYKQAKGLGSSSQLGYEEEYRLINSAKEINDKNIQDTINSLKHIGAPTKTAQPSGDNQQPIILQPAGSTQPASAQ